jgi:hypothetical protein
VQARRAAQATRHDPTGRVAAKIGLVRKLYRRGLTREQILSLYHFIDWLLRLPKELEDQALVAIQSIEEEQTMPHVTYAERHGIEQGQRQGFLAGIAAVLDVKFGTGSAELMPMFERIDDPTRLKAILDTIKTAATLDEVRAFAEQGE